MASTIGTALGSTQGSCLPLAARVVSSPSLLTVFLLFADGGSGFEGGSYNDVFTVADAPLNAP